MLALYGHPFSSLTWKVLIALYANGTPFAFRMVDAKNPENLAKVQLASPQGRMPVLADGDIMVFDASTIIEYLERNHPGPMQLLPDDADAAIMVRMLDRMFDGHVMKLLDPLIEDYLRNPASPDAELTAKVKARLHKSYAWLEDWLEFWPASEHITLIECAAAPALAYGGWVEPIGEEYPRLKAWRAHLLRLPAVARCIEEAKPYRAYFPPGMQGRE